MDTSVSHISDTCHFYNTVQTDFWKTPNKKNNPSCMDSSKIRASVKMNNGIRDTYKLIFVDSILKYL